MTMSSSGRGGAQIDQNGQGETVSLTVRASENEPSNGEDDNATPTT